MRTNRLPRRSCYGLPHVAGDQCFESISLQRESTNHRFPLGESRCGCASQQDRPHCPGCDDARGWLPGEVGSWAAGIDTASPIPGSVQAQAVVPAFGREPQLGRMVSATTAFGSKLLPLNNRIAARRADQIASLKPFATRNTTFFDALLALIWISSPVAGLRPLRAGRAGRIRTCRTPRLGMRILLPFFSTRAMSATKIACFLGML